MFNPLTKHEMIRHTYKILGPTVPSQTRPDYELDEAGNVTTTTVTQDTVEDTANVNDYKYLIGTIHRDDDELELYKTVDVLEEAFNGEEGPLIVAYRRRIKPNGRFEPQCEDNEYPIHIQDIVQMSADYANLHPEKTSKKATKNLARQLLAFGVAVQPASETGPSPKPTIDWSK